MTLAENVSLPLGEYTDLAPAEIEEIARFKLALVGLKGFEEFYPAEISGGMSKRAGLARALALDPDMLFFDEPSAGLDPISSRNLDQLILELRDSLGATFVVVSHELAQHIHHCRQLRLSRRAYPHDAGPGQSPRAAEEFHRSLRARIPDPRRIENNQISGGRHSLNPLQP